MPRVTKEQGKLCELLERSILRGSTESSPVDLIEQSPSTVEGLSAAGRFYLWSLATALGLLDDQAHRYKFFGLSRREQATAVLEAKLVYCSTIAEKVKQHE